MSSENNIAGVRKSDSLLAVTDLSKSFGGVKAVSGVSFSVEEGSITGMIGPNGAGKSTVVNLVSGFTRADSGSVRLGGREISKLAPYHVASLGLIRTFQISRELSKLTVLENLMLAPHDQFGEKSWQALFSRRTIRNEEAKRLAKALSILEQFSLFDMRDEYAGNLSGGQKKLLDLARAVMSDAKFLLLDEPMAGVNPTLVKTLAQYIKQLNSHGVTLLLIEHNLGIVEDICDHVIVMAEGRILAEGNMGNLRENIDVVAAYLGG